MARFKCCGLTARVRVRHHHCLFLAILRGMEYSTRGVEKGKAKLQPSLPGAPCPYRHHRRRYLFLRCASYPARSTFMNLPNFLHVAPGSPEAVGYPKLKILLPALRHTALFSHIYRCLPDPGPLVYYNGKRILWELHPSACYR